MSEQNLKKYIAELIQEVEKELEEATTTANVDGYQTPHAFSRKKDKERTRKNATQLGYELVDDDVDNITEAGLKGTENIPSNKKLSQLSDTDKLKIVQGTGNLISFKIPSWSKDKKWTVISSGKIVKKKNLNGETIFFLQGKGGIIKASPTYPSVKELLDGVNWDTMELRRESVNEGLFSDIMKGVKKGSSPYSLVVIQNNKVVKQVETNTDRAIPAHFTTLKKEYPNSRIRVEDSTGKIVFEK
jgi:hypothetical protein